MKKRKETETFGNRVIQFNQHLRFKHALPPGFEVINPFEDNPKIMQPMMDFYLKYYNDNRPRRMILGINPGRHGAGVTGVPFSDTKRLAEYCGIEVPGVVTHEVSSVFVYDMINSYGGPAHFYGDFYINSPFPLAIVQPSGSGRKVNCNYYDYPELLESLQPFIIDTIRKHIELGVDTGKAFVLGKKNAKFIGAMNLEHGFFERLIVLDHPRYIQQYRSKYKDEYIATYLESFAE